MNIIATTAGRNYHEIRAIEMIRDAVDSLDFNGEAEVYQEKMRMAIGLLALSLSEAPTGSEL
jgi:hypothetical protein